jgi:uncharacterized protein YcaQ
MSRIKSKERSAALARLLGEGEILEVGAEDIDQPLYMRSEDRVTLEQVLDSEDPPHRAAIIAPLDNLLWDRRFVEKLFGFSYIWEVYKPVDERRYGYYVLPVLYGDKFVARFEPGRDKGNGALLIKNWWWESGINQSQNMHLALHKCFERFLCFLGTDKVQIDQRIAEVAGLDWLVSNL